MVTGAPRSRTRQDKKKKGAEAQQESRNPEGLGGVPGCVQVESHSACAPRLLRGRGRTYPHTALSRTLGRPLLRGKPGRPSPSWSPLFCGRQTAALPVWTFCGAHRLWCPLVVFLPVLPRGLLGNTAAAHATSPRAVAVRLSSVAFLGGGRPGWSGGLSLGPLPPQLAPTVQ